MEKQSTSVRFEGVSGFLEQRNEEAIAFFLPYLNKSGMRILDAGCGPGTISFSLAKQRPNCIVVGVDHSEKLIERANSLLKASVKNVSFDVVDIQALLAKFGPNSFDAILFHAVLYLLTPERLENVLLQAYSLLKPNGIIGVRDSAWSHDIYPQQDAWQITRRLIADPIIENGGDMNLGLRLKNVLLNTGFVDVKGSASFEIYDTEKERFWAVDIVTQLVSGRSEFIKSQPWARDAQWDAVKKSMEDWAKQPSSFFARCRPEAIGWKY